MTANNEVEKTEEALPTGAAEGDEEEEEEESYEMEEDIYSMMFLSSYRSPAFRLGVCVFAFQVLVLFLALADMVSDAPDENPYKIPPDVPFQVATAQFCALIVSVLTAGDVFTSLECIIAVGYSDSTTERFPNASAEKWWISNLLRLLEGLMVVVVSFFFIIQSDNVLDLFMNFAALEFIAEWDNVAFWLAENGYFGPRCARGAERVKSVELPRTRKTRNWLCWWGVATIYVLMLMGLFTVRQRQMNGYYLKKEARLSLFVQFGGDHVYSLPQGTEFVGENPGFFEVNDPPALHYAFFSASYKASGDGDSLDRHNERPIYYERDAVECAQDPACGKFYYCEEVKAWVFTIEALGSACKQTNKCKWGWLARSPESEEFLLENVPTDGWKVWTGVLSDMEDFSIVSDVCRDDIDCSLNGKCQPDGKCQCTGGWLGNRCDVEVPFCPALMWVNYGETSADYYIVGTYKLFQDDDGPLLSYGRPIYYVERDDNYDPECPDFKTTEVIFYSGNRWLDTIWCTFMLEILREYVLAGREVLMHGYWFDVLDTKTNYYSEKTNNVMPTGIKWMEVRDTESKGSYAPFFASIERAATFECIDVGCENDDAVCGLQGSCVNINASEYCAPPKNCFPQGLDSLPSIHVCECWDGAGGEYCQFHREGRYARDEIELLVERLVEVGFNNSGSFLRESNFSDYIELYVVPYLLRDSAANDENGGDDEL